MTLENDPQPKATYLSVRDDHVERKMRFSCQELRDKISVVLSFCLYPVVRYLHLPI